VSAQTAKLTNKFILIIDKAREKIQNGAHISTITFPPVVNYIATEDSLSDCSAIESEDSFISSDSED